MTTGIELSGAQQNNSTGFSLIEMMVVLAVFSIITTLAVGAYRQYIQRVNRTDAIQLLLRVSAAQERFYLEENRYAFQADIAELGFPTAKSEHGHYQLSITPGPSGDPAVDYVAFARVTSGGGQSDDADCQEFSVTESGVKASDPEPPATCWD